MSEAPQAPQATSLRAQYEKARPYIKLAIEKGRRKFARPSEIRAVRRAVFDTVEVKDVEIDVERQKGEIDSLTEIYNRNGYERIIKQSLRRSARTGETISLMILDLNNLKAVNDDKIYGGHSAGDKLLKETAEILGSNVRQGLDYATRIGGDEFALILTGMNPEKIRTLFARLNLQFNSRNVSLGAGVATLNPNELGFLEEKLTPEEMEEKLTNAVEGLSAKADKVLFRAKDDAKKYGQNILYAYEDYENSIAANPITINNNQPT